MSIIMNERIFAEDAISLHTLGKKPAQTLSCVAKYYASQNYKHAEIRRLLEDFLIKCDPNINLLNWQTLIESTAKYAMKNQIVEIESVPITKRELEVCDSFSSTQEARLLFTLICLAKFSGMVKGEQTGWVNQQDKDIFKLANITKPIRIQSLMLNDLRDAGVIRFSNKIDNINIRVTCIDADGEPHLQISDFRNLGYQYMSRLGGQYVNCSECGKLIRRRGNNQKYCTTCATLVNQRKTEERRVSRHAS